MNRDTSERKRTDTAPSRIELIAATIIEGMPDGIMLVCMDGKVLYVNKAFEKMMGYEAEELIGTSAVELPTYRNSKDKENARWVLTRFIKKGSAEPTDMVAIAKDGKEIPIAFSASVIKGAQGNSKILVAIMRDISERRRADETTREAERRYNAIFDNRLQMVYIIDEQGLFLEANDYALQRLGYTRDDLGKVGVQDIVHPEDLPKALQTMADIATQGFIERPVELRLITKSGETIWIETFGIPLERSVDHFVAAAIAQDITEKKIAEGALRQREQDYLILLESTQDSIIVVDAETLKVVFGNRRASLMFGFDPVLHDGVGRNLLDFIYPEDREIAIKGFAEDLYQQERRQRYDARAKTNDGREIWVSALATRIEFQGRVAVLLSLRDITERKRAEELLSETEQKFKAIFDNAVDGIVLADPEDKKFYTCNKMFSQMLGYSQEEIKNLGVADIHPDADLPYAIQQFEKQLAGEITVAEGIQVKRKDGSIFYADINSSLIAVAGKSYMMGTFRDITERRQMEKALRHSEKYFRALAENSSDAVTVLDGDGTVRYEGPTTGRILGHIPGEQIGSNAFQFVHPDDMPVVAEVFAELLRNPGTSRQMEVRNRYKDGSWHVIEAVGTNLLDDPTVRGIIIHYRDITERKKAEESLRESEARYRLLAENVKDVITVVDMNLRPTYISPSVTQLLGYTVEEALAMSFEQGLTPASFDAIIKAFSEKLAAEASGQKDLPDSIVLEGEAKHKNGHLVPIEIGVNLMRDAEGKPAGILGVTRDITERKKVEEELRVSEERYRLVVENANEVIVVAQDGMLKFCNSRAIGILGYSSEELATKPFLEFIHPDDQQIVAERYIARLRGEEVPSTYSFRAVDRTGNTRWVEINAVVINWEDRPATLTFLTDITERKKVEELKKEMEEQLHLAGRLAAVGELAAGVAHELNNPIAAIQMYAEFLSQSNDLDEATKKDLKTIYGEAIRASKITGNLLSFARKHEPKKRLISINEAIEKTLELRGHQMKVNNIDLLMELQPDLPVTVADPNEMQQVFMNIIINAEQAMLEAHGRGKLHIQTKSANGRIKVALTDDGPGISEENLKRIFDPFFTTKPVGKGTGLGLSICFGIVQRHGGHIYARSKLGQGATFVVELPIVSSDQDVAEVAHPVQEGAGQDGRN